MIYDCFLFANELDILKIRLEELKNTVDRFVLIEATKGFSGRTKPLYFHENKEEFADYLDRIIYYRLDDMPAIKKNDRYFLERYQRNALLKVLQKCNCKEDDIILLSDVDEIPKATSIDRAIQLLDSHEMVIFVQRLYLYYLNNVSQGKNNRENWLGTIACKYKNLEGSCLFGIRFGGKHSTQRAGILQKDSRVESIYPRIVPGGWHLSWFGGYFAILYKYKMRTSKTLQVKKALKKAIEKTRLLEFEYIKHTTCRSNLHNSKNPAYKKYRILEARILPLPDDCICTQIYHDEDFEIDSDLPKYLQANKKKYKHFFKFAEPYDETKIQIYTFGKLYTLRKQISFIFNSGVEKIEALSKNILKSLYLKLKGLIKRSKGIFRK